MTQRQMITFLGAIEKNKCNTRHSWTSTGRQESVAEHSWRLSVMALLVGEHFSDIDIAKVTKMCIIHDFGEALTGDIPAFLKTQDDEDAEDKAVCELLGLLPESVQHDFKALFEEMAALETPEAKLFKALDNMEALISHNEAPLSTWLPREYEENLTYGAQNVEWSEWLKTLKQEINADSLAKIGRGN